MNLLIWLTLLHWFHEAAQTHTLNRREGPKDKMKSNVSIILRGVSLLFWHEFEPTAACQRHRQQKSPTRHCVKLGNSLSLSQSGCNSHDFKSSGQKEAGEAAGRQIEALVLTNIITPHKPRTIPQAATLGPHTKPRMVGFSTTSTCRQTSATWTSGDLPEHRK